MEQRTVLGIDLGQPAEFTALAAVREGGKDGAGRAVWEARLLRRWPLGTAYADIIRDVAALARRLGRAALALGVTGVGRPVAELFRDADLPVSDLACVTITAGHAASRVSWEEQCVPKKDLAGAVQSALQGRRLKVARGLAEKWQLVPVVAGEELLRAPDFRTPEEAAWFVRRVHELLGSAPPGDGPPGLGAKERAGVGGGRRRVPQRPPATAGGALRKAGSMGAASYFGGLDLGRPSQYTALAVAERTRDAARLAHYAVRELRRWPPGAGQDRKRSP